MKPTDRQPDPRPGLESVTDKVIDDFRFRREFGMTKYGTELQTFNGRDALSDLSQELMDAVLYLSQEIQERTILREAIENVMTAAVAVVDFWFSIEATEKTPGTTLIKNLDQSLVVLRELMPVKNIAEE